MATKYVEMTEPVAMAIAERFFEALKTLFEIIPLRFSFEDLYGQITVECDETTATITDDTYPADEENSLLFYNFLYKDKIFEITLVQDEGSFGYYSCLPNIDRSTYVFCNIVEYRKDDHTKRCEMNFAFDIEQRTFVELFSIEHFNKQGLIRECQIIDYLENILSGRVII